MKAPRDMTRPQFQTALKEHGFRQVLMWIEDTTGACPGVSWGVIIWQKSGKIARRATLAKVIRERDAEVSKQRAA